MKKLLLLMLSCMLMSIGVYAETKTYTYDFSSNTNWVTTKGGSTNVATGSSNKLNAFYYKTTGDEFNANSAGYFSTGYFLWGKSGKYIELPTFENEKITNVTAQGNPNGSPSTNVKVGIYSDSNVVVDAVQWSTKGAEYSYDIPEAYQSSVLRLQVTSAHNAQTVKIVITTETIDQGGETLVEPIIDWGTDFVAAFFDEENDFPTLTTSEDLDLSKLSYSSSDENVATVNSNGEVTLLAGGQTTITASYAGDGVKYKAASASYTLNVSALGDIMLNGKTDAQATVYAGEEVKFTAVNGTIVYTVNGGDPIISELWTPTEVGTYTINVTATFTTPREITHTKTATFTVEVTEAPTTSNVVFNFSEMGYSNATAVDNVVESPVTLTFAKGTNANNSPKFYNSSGTNSVRLYGGNTLKVEVSESYILTNIEVTFDTGDGSNSISVDNGSFSNVTWTATSETSSVTFTIGGTSGHRRIQKLVVTYAKKEVTPSDKTPVTLSFPEPAYTITYGDEFTAPTLTVDPAEATDAVVYTSNNDAVATVDAQTGAVTIVGAGETTITASISGSETYNNATASYTLTVRAAVSTLTKFIEVAPSVETIITEPVTVYYQSPDKKYTFITDGTSNFQVYAYTGLTNAYENGDQLTGIAGTIDSYGGVKQMIPNAATFGEATKVTPIEPKAVTLAETIDICEYVVLTGVSISGINGKNATLTQGTNTLQIYNRFGVELTEGDKTTVEGIVYEYNGTKQIYIISVDEGGEVVVELGAIEFNGAALEDNQTCDATVGQEITFSAANAETIAYTIGEDTQEAQGSSITWTPSAAGNYSVTVTATLGEETKTVNFTVTVTEATTPDVPDTEASYIKVTEAPADWSGKYLIVYEGGNVAFNGGLEELDAVSNTVEVTINDGVIAASDDLKAAEFTIAPSDGLWSIKSNSGYYIGNTYAKNYLTSSTDNVLVNEISFEDSSVKITAKDNATVSYLRFNATTDQMRFRYYTNGTSQKAIALYKYTAKSDDPSTGIEEVETAGNEPAQWYDLNGRRVAAPGKGIYILRQGGKATKYAF